ncbi:MAG: LysM peptidoglycan-binding domain-containing protein, partial [Phycisphaerales bacterium]
MKIGLVLGLVLVSAAALWLATRPSLSPKARMQQLHNAGPRQENSGLPGNLSTNELTNESTENSQLPIIDDQSELQDSTIHEQAEKIRTEKFHIVSKGETLSKISYKYYGSAGKWQKIFHANRKTIKDPDKVTPGTKLIIPD